MNNSFLQFLGITKKSGNLLEGYNKSEEAIKYKKAKLIILSNELSQNTKKKFKNYCTKQNIICIEGISKNDLGKATGRDEVNILCVVDHKMSTKLLDIWKSQFNI